MLLCIERLISKHSLKQEKIPAQPARQQFVVFHRIRRFLDFWSTPPRRLISLLKIRQSWRSKEAKNQGKSSGGHKCGGRPNPKC